MEAVRKTMMHKNRRMSKEWEERNILSVLWVRMSEVKEGDHHTFHDRQRGKESKKDDAQEGPQENGCSQGRRRRKRQERTKTKTATKRHKKKSGKWDRHVFLCSEVCFCLLHSWLETKSLQILSPFSCFSSLPDGDNVPLLFLEE